MNGGQKAKPGTGAEERRGHGMPSILLMISMALGRTRHPQRQTHKELT